MAESLVVRLDDSTAGSASWLAVDEFGVPLGTPVTGDLAAAAEESTGRSVIALVPAREAHRTSADVPVRGASKLLQALPFAMEEQLADDVDNLHFATGRRRDDERVPVAVVRREDMARWREALAEAGLDVAAIYVDGDVLGDIPATAILLIEEDYVTLREPEGDISAGDWDSLEGLMELWLARQAAPGDADEEAPPINLLVYASPSREPGLQPLLDAWRERVETLDLKVLPDGILPRMAAQAVGAPGINLLQGFYARGSNWWQYWPAWRVAALLLLGLVGTMITVQAAELFRLNRQAAALDQAIEQAFRYTFPQVREISDPRGQLEALLRAMGQTRTEATGGQFLDSLQAVATAVSAATNARIEAIDYRAGVMELRVQVPDVATLDKIQKQVSQDSRLQAEIQSANADGDKVSGRLRITAGGA